MYLFEIVTGVFIALKVFGIVDWSWWIVLLPEIISIGLAVIFWVVGIKSITMTFKPFFLKNKKEDS
jgi:hypothetical protein